MNKQNIVLDFASGTQVFEDQPLAVMPAELAKKLLRNYASSLTRRPVKDIINDHMNDLKRFHEAEDIDGALACSLAWIQERDLIDHVAQEKWDAYATTEMQPERV